MFIIISVQRGQCLPVGDESRYETEVKDDNFQSVECLRPSKIQVR